MFMLRDFKFQVETTDMLRPWLSQSLRKGKHFRRKKLVKTLFAGCVRTLQDVCKESFLPKS